MRLVLATPLYPPEIGGPATYAKLLEEGLPKTGKSDFPEIKVEVVKFGEVRHLPKLVRHYAYYRRVFRAAREADAVLALDPVSVGFPAMMAARRARKPFVVKVVGDYAWEQGRQRFGVTADLDTFVRTKRVPLPVRLLRRIQASVARRARAVIVPSEYLKGIVAAWGIPKEKIAVIYNAVPLETPGKVPEEAATLPRPRVVTAGRLVPWKHVDGVIDAVAALRKEGRDASLVVVGDGPERARLAARARQALGSGFSFTGSIPHADLLATLQDADVFVLNSSYEGLSHVLIEALSFGKPIIATKAGGNVELIEHERNGLLVPVNDTDELRDALTRMLTDASLSERLSAAAKAFAARFSAGAMLAETATLLQSV